MLIDSEIYGQLGLLDELRQHLADKITRKQAKVDTQFAQIESNKQEVYSKIDGFFNRIIEIA